MRAPRRLNLSITQIGLLLVFIPLAVGLIFIGTLFYLLQLSQLEAEKHLRARAIISQSNVVSRLYIDASLAMSNYCLTAVPVYADKYDITKKQLFTELDKLQSMAVSNEVEKGLLQKIYGQARQGIDYLDKSHHTLDHMSSDNVLMRQVFKEIRAVAGVLDPAMQELNNFETAFEKQSSQAKSEKSTLLQGALIAGGVLNILVAISAAIFFRDITFRLNLMRDNSYRLSRREVLNPRVDGRDEISELDGAFHEMATALVEANRKERALVENAVEVICSIDGHGVISELNPAAEQLWGYKQDELLGQRVMNLVAESDHEVTTQKFNDARNSKSVIKFENKTLAKSGTGVDAQWAVSWSPADNSLYCVIHDISERKKLEQLKREFIQMVSHDLRVPLTSLQMTLELLLTGVYGELSEKGRPRIQHAFSELERLINLINQLLEFERMESGKVEIYAEPTELSEVVTRSVEAVRSLAEKNKVSLNTNVFVIETSADAGKLIQVLVNLLGNAIKFSPPKTTVSATMERFEKYVEIRISDQGRGIPAEFRDKIFDRFEQVSIDDNRVKGGTGLGLAISKSIVVAHGGTIGVDSEEGAGSSFWIRLPLS
ncbi:MAG TPA: PAS domain S-box protein [Candidatus Melainabacteria bacterium]|nr:PAS domain S-box protein [Candidatus Melainabacteria bacterium]HIN67302.1 PAS domain S-box protein [Candidatus Obscuribacterales bacterium]